MTYNEAKSILDMCGSHEVLPELLEMTGLSGKTFIQLLGQIWSRSTNISLCNAEGELEERIFSAAEPESQGERRTYFTPHTWHIPHLMTAEEYNALLRLPAQVMIYRGCGPVNKYGLSWSLDKRVAQRFPYTARYQQTEPLLMTAKVHRKNILALKLDCNEAEVIVPSIRAMALGIGKECLPYHSPRSITLGQLLAGPEGAIAIGS